MGAALFVWTASVAGGVEVRGRIFDADGVAVSDHDIPIVVASGLGIGWHAEPTVAAVGTGWVVAWTAAEPIAADQADVAYALVASDGSVAPPALANTTVAYIHTRRVSRARLPGS
jgi:hypothetical protein